LTRSWIRSWVFMRGHRTYKLSSPGLTRRSIA
jgi:hypothetical protein